jgi:hypothetical protein
MAATRESHVISFPVCRIQNGNAEEQDCSEKRRAFDGDQGAAWRIAHPGIAVAGFEIRPTH